MGKDVSAVCDYGVATIIRFLKLQVSFAKEPYKIDYILHANRSLLCAKRSLLCVEYVFFARRYVSFEVSIGFFCVQGGLFRVQASFVFE